MMEERSITPAVMTVNSLNFPSKELILFLEKKESVPPVMALMSFPVPFCIITITIIEMLEMTIKTKNAIQNPKKTSLFVVAAISALNIFYSSIRNSVTDFITKVGILQVFCAKKIFSVIKKEK